MKVNSVIREADPTMAAVPKAQKLAKRAKYSNFLLTINTNQAIQPTDAAFEAARKRFRGILEQILGGNNIIRYVKWREQGVDATNGPDKIESVNVETTIEVGSANVSLHSHSLVQFKHHTVLHLDQMKMRHVIKRGMGIDGECHLNIKMVSRNANTDLQSVTAYIRKDLPEAPADETDNVAEYIK